MLRKTYKILAVAMTVTACGGAAAAPDEAPPTQATPNKQALAKELSNTTLDDALNHAEHYTPLCDGDGYPLPGNINSKESGSGSHGTTVSQFCDAIKKPASAAPSPPAQPSPPTVSPTPAAACDREALNKELSNAQLDHAVEEHAHYRCLCDADGYPLVGNINSKGANASQLCSALRERGLK